MTEKREAWAAMIGAIVVLAAALVLIHEHPYRRMEEAPMSIPAHAWIEGFSDTCLETVTVDIGVQGSYTSRPFIDPWHGPSLVIGTLDHSFSDPFFAAEFSVPELCSTEASEPTHVRIVCLSKEGKPETIDLRVTPDGKDLAIATNGHEWKGSEGGGRKTKCLELKTDIPKRDLAPLQRAFLDDSPSERCSKTKAPRRKVPAVVQRVLLPKDDERAGADYLRLQTDWLPHRLCRDTTKVRIVLPPTVGPSVDLGVFADQCERCSGGLLDEPNGVSFRCHGHWSASALLVYQLGDHLYIAEENHIRRVPLPCGVELDFRIDEFVGLLGIDPPASKKK
ncbi:hypothetical protein QHF85_27800 [Polyangium sp. 6x1]|nr:hypothetical protein [Polyangium sp. 6x1]